MLENKFYVHVKGILKHPKTLDIEDNFYKRKIRESLEINKAKTNDKKIVNRDDGSFVTTSSWKPLFKKMK